jgi:molybdenum cofactor cytidylyltransferase
MPVAAILLAAGSARRFGDEKLLAPYRGRALYEHGLEALAACALVDEIVVVVRPGLPLPPERPRVRFIANPEHAEGMGSSLRAGVRAAGADAEAWLIALADMPDVTAGLIAALIAAWRTTGKPILVPIHRGRRGHPVVFGGGLRERLLEIRGDVGARGILEAHPEMVGEFPTDDPAVLFDVDTRADLERRR